MSKKSRSYKWIYTHTKRLNQLRHELMTTYYVPQKVVGSLKTLKALRELRDRLKKET